MKLHIEIRDDHIDSVSFSQFLKFVIGPAPNYLQT